MLIFIYYILYEASYIIYFLCENLFPAGGGRRSVVTCTMCMNGVVHVLTDGRMLLCQVLQVDYGPVRGFLNSFNAVTFVGSSFCRVCRVDNCCCFWSIHVS